MLCWVNSWLRALLDGGAIVLKELEAGAALENCRRPAMPEGIGECELVLNCLANFALSC